MLVMDTYLPVYTASSPLMSTLKKAFVMIGDVTMYIALILTVVSLIDYLLKNKDVLKDVD